MRPAFLFPGQGAQSVGMGRELYERYPVAKAVFDEADEALGFPLSERMFDGPAEVLQLTEYAQPAILTHSVAAFRVLEQALPQLVPVVAAGHSLGEYSAHVASGTLTFTDAVRAVHARGRFMQEAVAPGKGTMAAILGLSPQRVAELCAEATASLGAPEVVAAANLNTPEQTVISGSLAAVELAVELLKQAGARKTLLLKVSAPFHCTLMQPAQTRLATVLEAIPFSAPAYPVVSNVDARLVTGPDDIRDCLIRQVTGAVRWVECLNVVLAEQPTHLIELGPGKVLGGLTRQILGRSVESPVSLNVEDAESLEKTVAAVGVS